MAKIPEWTRPKTVDYPMVYRRFDGRKPFPNGKIPKFRIQDLTEDLLEDAIQLMVDHYVPEEPLGKSLDIVNDPLAVEDLKAIWRAYAGFKMGLVGILENGHELGDEKLPKIIGCNMTGVLLKGQHAIEYTPKSENMKLMLDFLDYQHNAVDVFKHYQVTECLYALGLSVHTAFRGHGIGYEFMRARFELGKSVGLKATVTIFTNIASQTVAKQAGFETLFEIMYDEYKVGDLIPFKIKSTKSSTLMGKRID